MEIGYQVDSMREFGCGDLTGVQIHLQYLHTLARSSCFTCLSAINFKIYYLRNFIFRFPINYDWSGGWLYSLRESVGCGRFKYGHMEDCMNRVHGLWKTESE